MARPPHAGPVLPPRTPRPPGAALSHPWHAWLLLLHPARVHARLERVRARGLVPVVPNLWQLELGALRMWHRTVFRSETVGTSTAPVRRGWRARLLALRPLRGPFLLWERAIAPWDMTGLFSSPERVVRHLLGAHHDANQCCYDFELLALHEGWIEALRGRVAAVVTAADPRAPYLRDLCAYEGYHEHLLACVDAWSRGELRLGPAEADDPDISFPAFLRWCAAQPETPAAWWAAVRAGRWGPVAGGRSG